MTSSRKSLVVTSAFQSFRQEEPASEVHKTTYLLETNSYILKSASTTTSEAEIMISERV